MSSLADALEATTESILGSFQDALAIQELLQRAPNANILQLVLVRSICEATPQAAQDAKILEEELRNSMNVGRIYSELIDVFIGPTNETFKVHKSDRVPIPYFAKCVNGSFRETRGFVATLPEEKPEAFQRVLDYLYTNQISDCILKNFANHNEAALRAEGLNIMELYVLTDMFYVEESANKIMDLLRKSYNDGGTCAEAMLLATEKGNSQLKNLVFRAAVSHIVADGRVHYMSKHDGIRDDFRADVKNAEELAKVLADHAKDGNPAHEKDGCKWHVHVNTPRCTQKVEGNGT